MKRASRAVGAWSLAIVLFAACVVANVAGCGSSGGGGQQNVASPAWEEQVIYMVMTDRFANGNAANDDQGKGEFDPTNLNKYSGGDIQGLIDRLDYIQGLGATAVWITPPVANMWWDPLQQSGGYHGYWARNLKKVDEHLGTLDTYKALASALHQRGMYLIQDVVPNHMGNFFTYTSYDPNCVPLWTAPDCDVTKGFLRNKNAVPTSAPDQSPFDQDDPTDPVQRAAAIYHWTPTITNYGDPNQILNYQVSDLDDLNSENPVVRTALRDSYAYWIKEVGVDGFRVDTAYYVPHDFWNDFFHSSDAAAPGIMPAAAATGRSKFIAFGEVNLVPDPMTDTVDKTVASYLGTAQAPELNSVLNFPLYKEIERVFASGQPTSYMTYRLGRMMDPTLFPNPYILPNFIDNHDVRRFLSITSSTGENLLQALAFLFSVPGIPVVYYGTEQGFTVTRQAMFKGGYGSTQDAYNTSGAVYQRIKKLAGIRKGSQALMHGAMDVVYDQVAGPGVFAFRRTQGAETLIALFNTSTQKALVADLDTKLPGGSVLEVLHDEQNPPSPSVDAAGKVTMVLPPTAVILARATGQTVTPPTPGATLALLTPIAGAALTQDTVLTGTVSPPGTHLELVLDGNLAKAIPATVPGDGTWSATLPVSAFPSGSFQHDVAIYAPDVNVATPPARFTSNVVFSGQTCAYTDPAGDDTGPKGAYTYPTDVTFAHQMDVTGVKLEVGSTTMNLNLTMANVTSIWVPQNGFDHVYFNIYFSVPGGANPATVMPKLNASVPAGFSWSFNQFSGGFDNYMYTSTGATSDAHGGNAVGPTIKVSGNTITFTYDRNNFGIPTWDGVKVYIATWDFDGINAVFRPLTKDGGEWTMGGGGPPYTPDAVDPTILYSADPKIMDDVPVLTLSSTSCPPPN